MTAEQQNENWARLTPEFRKEVKRLYSLGADREFDRGYDYALYMLFGKHNLTSDTEPKFKVGIQKQDWGKYTRYLIIHEHGSVFLNVFSEVQDSFGGNAYIWGLFVLPSERRKGIGKTLLDEAERLAQTLGCKSVVLEWVSKNTSHEILDWYLRFGYDVVGHYREEQYTLEKKL